LGAFPGQESVEAQLRVSYFGNNIQLVSYARKYEEFEKCGTRIVSISVDPPEHNKAMVERLALPFSLLSDPKGDLAKR
jgi:peroxiredoxin